MDQNKTPYSVGVYLAVVQFFFTVTWTVYVIFLPKLATQAGIAKSAIPYILLLDQVIFAFMDFAMGVAADRVSNVLGRLGHIVLGVTLFSCLAFLLLPFAAPQGMAWLFLLLTILWAASSSVLRAPPLMLLGKYAAKPQVPWLSSLALFGLGVAGAVAPYLTVTLRDTDPRLPFALSSVALALTVLGIMWAERALARTSAEKKSAPTISGVLSPITISFFVAVLIAAVAFQIHSTLNSGPAFLKFVKPPQLQYVSPIFWIGFNVLMLAGAPATKRFGGLAVTGAGALLAGIGALFAMKASSLAMLIALQFIAGGGWGLVLMSAVSAALAIGHTGREGQLTGGVFALLAVATVTRMAVVTAELNKDPQLKDFFTWLPATGWLIAGAVLLALAIYGGKSLRQIDTSAALPAAARRIKPRSLGDIAKPTRFDAE